MGSAIIGTVKGNRHRTATIHFRSQTGYVEGQNVGERQQLAASNHLTPCY
jgi:hypothetical protein